MAFFRTAVLIPIIMSIFLLVCCSKYFKNYPNWSIPHSGLSLSNQCGPITKYTSVISVS